MSDQELLSEQNHRGILDYLENIQKKFPVEEWEMFGFRIWPIIRISLGLKLTSKKFQTKENQISKQSSTLFSNAMKDVFTSLSNEFKDSSNNQNTKQSYDVVFLNVSSTRYFKLDNKWYNPFSDSFINYLEKDNISSLVLEYPDTENKIPRYRGSKYIGTGINFMNLNVIFEKTFEKNNPSELSQFENFLSFVNLSQAFFLQKILRISNYSIYFEKILKKTKPSLVILEGYYSYLAMGLILAAKRQKIKCIDVQHGVQSEDDFLYSEWDNIPSDGYELLPDIFWCWSEAEKKNIDKWGNENYKSITGGNPVLEVDLQNNFMKNCNDEILSAKNLRENSINIFYTHQASFELSGLLLGAIKNSPANWQWWIRLHPQYADAGEKVMEQLSKHNFANVITGEITSYPIALLLPKMNLHVTESSSSVLEAEAIGIPSVLINRAGDALYKKQIESGIAEFAHDEKTFFEFAENLMNKKRSFAKQSNKEKFEEGIKLIKNIIREKSKV
jgi:hypothetical protein